MKKLLCLTLSFLIIVAGTITGYAAAPEAGTPVVEEDISEPALLDEDFILSSDLKEDANGAFILTRETILESDGTNVDYKSDTIVIMPLDQKASKEIKKNLMALRAGGSKTEYDIDGSYSVTGYLTVYYTRGTYSGDETIEITKVTGRYTNSDSSVHVKSQSVFCAMNGKTTAGTRTQQQTKAVSGTSWTYTPPSSWYPLLNIDANVAGADYTITMVRGTTHGA